MEIDVVNNSNNGGATIHEEIIIDSGPASPEIQIIDVVDTNQDACENYLFRTLIIFDTLT